MKANPETGTVRWRTEFPIISGYLPSSTTLNQIRFSQKTNKKFEIGLEMRVEIFFDFSFEFSGTDYAVIITVCKCKS